MATNGVGSFYGVHPYTTVKMSPSLSVQVPVNSLYGPHLRFGAGTDNELDDNIEDEDTIKHWHYCPNCGSKMVGEAL